MTSLSAVPKSNGEKFCSECASIINAKAEICPRCGVRQMAPPASAHNGKSRIVAAILAFFLGGFGFHRFYLNQVGLGFLYLIFFWTFIPAFVAFIDCILLLIMSDETFNARYGAA